MSTKFEQKIVLSREIAQASIPERCSGCRISEVMARSMADRVLAGEVEKPEAITKVRDGLETNCRYGLTIEDGGCFDSGAKCNYSTLNQMPASTTRSSY